MKQLKKTILTLALLLTAATGARAAWTGGTYTATATENLGAITVNGDATLTINSDVTVTVTGGINVASGTLTVKGPGTLVVNGKAGSNGSNSGPNDGGAGGTGGVAISGNIIVQGGATVKATGGNGGNGGKSDAGTGGKGAQGGAAITGEVTIQDASTLEATGGNGGNGGWGDSAGGNGANGANAIGGTLNYKGGTVTANGGNGGSCGGSGSGSDGSGGSAGKAFTTSVNFVSSDYILTDGTSTIGSVLNQTKVVISGGTDPAPSSGPEVTWTAATKTGSFTMPGGNVTLEPEYYPQATVAEGAVTAADADARATTDDPLVKVDATKLTGAKKLMYFVSNSGTTAPAYDAEGWTDQLPTAEGFTQQGIVYVWYYPVGTDEGVDGATATYSDGDIMPLGTNGLVTIAAAPTYAVTFADGVNPEPPAEPEWTADPATGVTKGQTVTVTYNGTKKVIGVKAEKKAAGTPLGNPLTIEAITPGTITVNIDGELTTGMKYSVNGGTPTLITTTTNIEGLKAGDKVQFYGNGTQTQAYGDFPEVKIQGSGDGFKTKVYGNIMSLLDEEGFATKTDLPDASYVFYGLFMQNSTLVDASELLLPATTLATACYQVMFQGCTSLTTAPKLPATTLTTSCYYAMFSGCTSLTNAYVKAAYTDYDNASSSMFVDCSATGAVLHTTPDNKASWEAKMGTGKTWPNWSVADDWEE